MKKIVTLLIVALLAGCATGSRAPMQTYDFGPADSAMTGARPDVFVSDVRAAEWLNTNDMLYRLEYRDPRLLSPYGTSRWAGIPAAMLTARLRMYVGNGQSARDRQTKCTLTLFLSEFSQIFKTEHDSIAVMHLRATLNEVGSGKRAAVREIKIERPTPSADAAGAAAAFAESVKLAATELNTWVDQSGSCKE
ncbi:MAG: ABC-type transport auxiliary lipoprotein family protein [Casimicrobiaceae bacterium]